MSDLTRLIGCAMAGFLRSRAALQAEKPNPSTSAQCVETQIAEARGRRQHRSIAVCRTLSHLPQGTRRAQNPQARDRPALASRGFSGVLALEITIVRRPAKDARGHSS